MSEERSSQEIIEQVQSLAAEASADSQPTAKQFRIEYIVRQ